LGNRLLNHGAQFRVALLIGVRTRAAEERDESRASGRNASE
jgi:hypothetical protein